MSPRTPSLREYRCFAWIAIATLTLFASSAKAVVISTQQHGTQRNLIKELLIASLPPVYEDKPNWGKTVRIFNGLKWRGKGLRIRVEKQKKEVNHGLWEHYRIRLKDPLNDLRVEILDFRHVGGDEFTFRVYLAVRLDSYAHWIQWSNGVKLFSVDAEADAIIQWWLDCKMRIRVTGPSWLPEVALEPRVVDSELKMYAFRLRKFGHLRGGMARGLGRGLQRAIGRMIARNERKAGEATNVALAKSIRAGKFRFSGGEWFMRQWNDLSEDRAFGGAPWRPARSSSKLVVDADSKAVRRRPLVR